MVRLVTGGGASALVLVVGLSLGCLFGATGCGPAGKPEPSAGEMSPAELDQAQRLLTELESAHHRGQDQQTLNLADMILTQYPRFSRNDVVLATAADAAARSGEVTRALDFTDRLAERFPGSSVLGPALDRGAGQALAVGDSLKAAGYLVMRFDLDPVGQTGPDGLPRATAWLRRLNLEQLAVLAARHPRSGLEPQLAYLQVEGLLAADRFTEAEAQVVNLERRAPTGTWTLAARDLLEGGQGAFGNRGAASVRPDLVGVICPLTGRYAVLGNAFYEAALLALEETNAEFGTTFEFLVEDSQADPVVAALDARKFCRQEGCIALLGPMMSDPTATAALVADRWKVPLVSPTATNDRLWELGETVFQTNLTGQFETRLLASLAVSVMLKERFGLLYPDTDEGRGFAEVFRSEVEALGGQIVGEVAFPPRGTDFKVPIQTLRRHRPEVLFIPATVDQMVLLGPQLDFYHAGTLVMGLSNWNSEKLRERSGTVLERAIFPNDLALFPEEWAAAFEARWNSENYPVEATALALKSYQASRLLLDTLARSQATSRGQLTRALRDRLAQRGFETAGPESFTGSVRMFRGEEIVPFPGGRFAEAWSLTEGALPDSTLQPEPDLLPAETAP